MRGSGQLLTLSKLKSWAKTLKENILALYLSARNERMPALPKWLALITVAYAISPIDLVPDFIPIIGYADDLILLPLLIMLCIRLTPGEVWSESLSAARRGSVPNFMGGKLAASAIVITWLSVLMTAVLVLVD